MFTNHYLCPCGTEWDDEWDCACNDHCPGCDAEIEPFISDDGSLAPNAIEEARVALIASRAGAIATGSDTGYSFPIINTTTPLPCTIVAPSTNKESRDGDDTGTD